MKKWYVVEKLMWNLLEGFAVETKEPSAVSSREKNASSYLWKKIHALESLTAKYMIC